MSPRTWHPDGPGSFRTPNGVHTVRDRHGQLWTRNTTRWTTTGITWIRWRALIANHGPLTEEKTRPATPRPSGYSQPRAQENH